MRFNAPIWLRVTGGVILAVLIPTILSLILIQREVAAVDTDNLQAYVEDLGRNRQRAILNDLEQARVVLISFARDRAIQLIYRSTANLTGQTDTFMSSTIEGIRRALVERLFGPNIFDRVLLVAEDGRVILAIEEGNVETLPTGADYSGSVAFEAGQTAAQLGVDQRMIVSTENDQLILQIVQPFYDGDEAIGYMIGRVDREAVFFQHLQGQSTFLPTNSYLATADGEFIAVDEDLSAASAAVSPISEGVAQRTGIATYQFADKDYIGHYTPIVGTPLALITEVSAEFSFVQDLSGTFAQGAVIVLVPLLIAAAIATAINLTLIPPLNSLKSDIESVGSGMMDSTVATAARSDEIGSLARVFVSVRQQVADMLTDFEQRVALGVRDLQATHEVSRVAASQRDPAILMDGAVNLIVEQFSNIYHAQIFLLDYERRYAVLRASTGEAGRLLLERGHRLEVGSVSVIGQVTEEGRVVIARDTGTSDVHRANEFLPETRAELAIPLRSGSRVIGALDVQSRLSDTFHHDQVTVLRIMADQIAIAIEHARLYQESMQRMEEVRVANREMTGRTWREYMNAQRQKLLTMAAGAPQQDDLDDLRQQAVQRGVPVIGDITSRQTVPFAIPIQLRDRILGAVQWELPAADFNQDKVELAEELVNRLAISLDNARLFQESRRAINRERVVNDIAAQLFGQTDIDTILQTAVREVGQALRVPQVNIDLKLQDSGDTTPVKNGGRS